MKLLPVIDLKGGQVVRGIAGRRREYAPIVSRLTRSSRPLDIARAFGEQFGFDELYLADLDAIAGQPPAVDLFQQLLDDGWTPWIDAGPAWDQLGALGIPNIIAGLESLEGPEQLRDVVERLSSDRLVFSLDLKNGRPFARPSLAIRANDRRTEWHSDSQAVAGQAVECGVRRILVLDLVAVGMGQGTPTAELCGRLRSLHPFLEISTGGGVRGIDDLRNLEKIGVDHVLIASALHDGCLTPTTLLSWKQC